MVCPVKPKEGLQYASLPLLTVLPLPVLLLLHHASSVLHWMMLEWLWDINKKNGYEIFDPVAVYTGVLRIFHKYTCIVD